MTKKQNVPVAIGAQGEVRIFRVASIPNGLIETKDRIIGHSETGHHHVLTAERVKIYQEKDAPEGIRVLYALLESPGSLEHLRDHDTHAPHHFDVGDVLMFRCDREYDPYAEIARAVSD